MVLKVDTTDYAAEMSGPFPLNAGNKKVKSILTKLEKEFGESVQIGKFQEHVEPLSTGSLLLDLATRIGGYPRGRISVLAGWESSGKTTHALKAIANLQEKGGSAVFIDTEYTFDPVWAKQQGVSLSDDVFTLIQPSDLETAGEVAVDFAESGAVDMIVLDSVAGAPIKAVVGGDLGDANMGKKGKIMSDFTPKLNGPVARNNIWMLFTNQYRDSLDPYKPKPVKPGGHALNFMASLIIEVRRLKREKDGSIVVRGTIEKNKSGYPGAQVEYIIDRDGFINQINELTSVLTTSEYAEVLGVTQAGAYYTLPGHLFPDMEQAKFMGRAKIEEALSDLDAFERSWDYVKSKLLAN